MILSLACLAVAGALLALTWSVYRLAGAIERQASRVEAHGKQLAVFGRAVYGSSGTTAPPVGSQTVADADAAAKLAASEEARKSGPG